MPTPLALARYEAARKALAAAVTVVEVKEIRNVVEGMRAFARVAGDPIGLADWSEMRLRAERRLGELMRDQAPGEGRAPRGRPKKIVSAELFSAPATLAEAGIDANLAHRARRSAAASGEEFEEKVAAMRDAIMAAASKLATKLDGMHRKAARSPKDEAGETCTTDDLEDLADRIGAGDRPGFAGIYADPPWSFDTYSEAGKDRSAEKHYPTMRLDDIAALPVGRLAAPDCALFLWGTWPNLPDAFAVLEAWGFDYKTSAFVWIKENPKSGGLFQGLGYWTRANSEPCLLATRGKPRRLNADVGQVIMSPIGKHSEKPAEARRRIHRLVDGPYLELFGRTPAAGWTVWGNEIPRSYLEADADAARETESA